MCIVCVELIKQKLTITEAEKNLGEIISSRPQSMSEPIDDVFEDYHQRRLLRAIEDLDLDYLDVVLTEGSEDETKLN